MQRPYDKLNLANLDNLGKILIHTTKKGRNILRPYKNIIRSLSLPKRQLNAYLQCQMPSIALLESPFSLTSVPD
jgi:hypothetical protein